MYVGSLHFSLGGCWSQQEDEPQDQEWQGYYTWQQDEESQENQETKEA